ncbi:hypothetical protein AVEN_135114-1 [Araneus ventricosus]|uniref:Uncharacterized protein n=1 Tax=Araneus ventricosus TaxID=182803 RepID=A0A4Y2JMM9_ARAVE|nr:hypothetical protein AVEN_135114-1 [Araneus ventricosus]
MTRRTSEPAPKSPDFKAPLTLVCLTLNDGFNVNQAHIRIRSSVESGIQHMIFRPPGEKPWTGLPQVDESKKGGVYAWRVFGGTEARTRDPSSRSLLLTTHHRNFKSSSMTTAIIPVLAAMYLGSTFNLVKYQKGNADVFDQRTLEGNLQVIDRSFTRSQYKLVETSTQAREFLDVSGALSLRIKKGDIVVDGTGAYLKDTANRQKFVELLVRVQHETVSIQLTFSFLYTKSTL